MWTTRRPTQASRIFTNGLVASLALGMELTGCATTAGSVEDRAAGAAGGQGRRDDGGLGRATVSPPSACRDRLSSPAAPSDAVNDPNATIDRSKPRRGSATRRCQDRSKELTGMMCECFPVDTDYVVPSQRWGSRGAGVVRGNRIPGLVGPEVDRVHPTGSLPRPMQSLSHSPYSCRGVTTVAGSVYYTAPSAAGVFNAGTLRGGCAIVDRCEPPPGARTARFVEVVTGNVLRGFARGPAARRHPVQDNVRDFDADLSPVNAVSAS